MMLDVLTLVYIILGWALNTGCVKFTIPNQNIPAGIRIAILVPNFDLCMEFHIASESGLLGEGRLRWIVNPTQ